MEVVIPSSLFTTPLDSSLGVLGRVLNIYIEVSA